MTARHGLSRLLSPKSIAFIGGRDAAEAVRVCRRFGYQGAIWLVNPTREAMDGVPCYPSLDALPSAPDAAFIGVNRSATPGIVAALASMGAGGATAYASGFSEAAGEIAGGGDLEAALIGAAGSMPVLGPNCYGLINAASGACLWPSEHGVTRCSRGVAIVSQSTNIVLSMTMQRRGLPIAFVATVGNQAQTGLSTIARALLAEEHVTALGLYVEGIDTAAGMEALAAEARAAGKPVVVLKAGRSEGARAATLSHTAAIAGSDAAASAFFDRLGIARVGSMTAFLETLKLLHVHGPLPGARLSALCCSGGETAVLSDTAEGRRVQFPPLAEPQRQAIKATLSEMVTVANPLDYHTFIWADEARLTETYAALFASGFDLSLLTLDWVRTDRCSDADWYPALAAVEAATKRTGARAGVLACLPENMPEGVADRLIAQGIVPLVGMDDALNAAEAAAEIGQSWAAPAAASLVPVPGLDRPSVLLDEAAAKDILASAGVPLPRRLIGTADEIASAARALDGPFALKALGLAHKTEAGAVALNLPHATLRAAASEMAVRTGAKRFLVEEMAAAPVAELLVGAKRDAPYGITLTLGAGGVYAEIQQDSVTLLLPTTPEAIRSALGTLRLAPILAGYRGRPAAEIDAVVEAIVRVAAFATDHADRLIELDINPLIATETGAVAVDALIRWEERE